MKDIKKPSIFKKLFNKEDQLKSKDDFEFLLKMSKITDYSEVMTNSTSPEKAITHAIIASNYKVVEETLRDVNISEIKDDKNNNILHILANQEYSNNRSLIIEKIGHENTGNYVVPFNINNKKNYNALFNMKNNEEKTPIDILITNNNFKLINAACVWFTIENADKYNDINIDGKPLLIHLLKNGHDSAVRQFIIGNASLDIKDKEGNTIVHYAINEHNNLGTINQLIKRNANPDIENNQGLTPLMVACTSVVSNHNKIDCLCEGLRADVNYKNKDNKAAMHYLLNASINIENNSDGKESMLKSLIKCGANIHMP